MAEPLRRVARSGYPGGSRYASANGTWLGRMKLLKHYPRPLSDGDVIRICGKERAVVRGVERDAECEWAGEELEEGSKSWEETEKELEAMERSVADQK